ncbi:hypothetical protein F2Q68_00036194 [Brassica cretica]|uniref:Uncharacterized protein n=1 Tax=Brassica cretica TaxID=69181 RepID=A0A8S9H5E2_BRACR|nr:hypothetical protein F2Q68_00036194 [Brassica cretica]
MLHTAPTVDKKALPSNREEFQFSLISKTWKSTGTRALSIFTSRPRWSAITLGRMLTDAHVSHNACGNSIPFTMHSTANFPGSLFFFSVIISFIFSLASQNILLMSSSVSLVSLKNMHNLWVKYTSSNGFSNGILKTLFWKLSISFSLASLFRCLATFPFLFLKVLPIGALSTSIGSAASSECVLVVFGGLAEGLDCGLGALRRAMSIFGICTQYVRGERRSMGAGGCRSMVVSSIDALESPSIGFDLSSSIDVRSLAPIDTNAIRRSSSSFLLRNLLLAASPASPLARNHHL